MDKIRFTVFITIFLLLSGCGGVQDGIPVTSTRGPDGSPTTTVTDTATRETTVTSNESISVRGGTLSVNPDIVFSNVLTLTGADAHQPIILIENRTKTAGNDISAVLVDDFDVALGLTPPENTSTSDRPGGSTVKSTVRVLPGNGSEAEVERMLAHEFVHVIQYQNDWPLHLRTSATNVDANDHLLMSCLIEGSATYVTDEYIRRYSVNIAPDTALVREEYSTSNGARKYFYAPYYFCSRYFHFRLDSPANVTEVFRNPPVTTEQILHNYSPGEELPKPLNVTVEEANVSWDPRKGSTKGELFTRVVLANVLSEDDAARAAAGWGNDRLLEFRNDGRKGYVWVLRWDSATDTEQFAQTFDRYLKARNVGLDGCLDRMCFERRRLGPRTSVVLVGPSSFVSNVTVEVENSSVRVSMA